MGIGTSADVTGNREGVAVGDALPDANGLADAVAVMEGDWPNAMLAKQIVEQTAKDRRFISLTTSRKLALVGAVVRSFGVLVNKKRK